TASGQTLQLDAAQGVGEPGEGSAQFQSASTSGSKVFFTDKQLLTPESSAEPFTGKADLYEGEVRENPEHQLSRDLRDLTVAENGGEPSAVQGLLLGTSENGSSVYLVAQGVLAKNENGHRERAELGKDNLYALKEAGAGEWTRTFVSQLSGEDSPEWE